MVTDNVALNLIDNSWTVDIIVELLKKIKNI